VNATGCFADVIRKMDNPTTLNKIVPSGGSHIILPYKYGSDWGLLVPETSDGRILFVLPWLDRTLVGTTDKLFSEPVLTKPYT
jgi:glycerol-3-phosphate dehydrogenase